MSWKPTIVASLLGLSVLGSSGESPKAALTADEALKALTEGNARYVMGTAQGPRRDQERRCDTFANGQHPVAAVLSCADSRVPAELIFDQGIGDLFVIRVAGNVADTDEVGTLEYGVEHLGTPVVVAMGHSKCGAVTAVVEKAQVHGCMEQLVDNIVPAVERARQENPKATGAAMVAAATQQNVWQSIEDMYARSDVLREAAKAGKIKVVGAIYDLHSGTVQWMGQHPQEAALLKEGRVAAAKIEKPRQEGGEKAPKAAAPEPEKAKLPAAGQGEEKPARSESHSNVSPTTAPAEAQQKDNYVALAGMMCGGMVVSGVVIRLVGKKHPAAQQPAGDGEHEAQSH
jgi:carbonic anhydrase